MKKILSHLFLEFNMNSIYFYGNNDQNRVSYLYDAIISKNLDLFIGSEALTILKEKGLLI
ncbi:hypothetical protein Ct9H90mP29_06820 [bacterium]|nr:MAG: hypothetical protein Ct9H90mP29_06820 [bacterium]